MHANRDQVVICLCPLRACNKPLSLSTGSPDSHDLHNIQITASTAAKLVTSTEEYAFHTQVAVSIVKQFLAVLSKGRNMHRFGELYDGLDCDIIDFITSFPEIMQSPIMQFLKQAKVRLSVSQLNL